MVQKIKQWLKLRRLHRHTQQQLSPQQDTYTYEQVVNAYTAGYNDGKRDGIAVARELATKSLKEILWQQSRTNPPK